MKERSNLSVHSLSESEDNPFRDQPITSSPLHHAASEDNLSTSTGEMVATLGRRGNQQRDSPGFWNQAQKKGAQKLEKREESLEVKRRKKRSRSFEVNGQGLGGPKNHPSRNRALESNSDHKIQSSIPQNVNSRRKIVLPIAHVKLPQNQAGNLAKVGDHQGAGSQPGNAKKQISTNQRPRFNYNTGNAGGINGKEIRVRKY
ncbi:unnamed protein product [Ranitomeya imitator]|uniref:Uncharacterized protein n=2 Tax=Ranitomeya imitator TaxID=111125 RepID=A0ABN9KTG5_9NEOB|nr:unnamed protein product [Ranitomeya imitator]